jgi:hypothetical protein
MPQRVTRARCMSSMHELAPPPTSAWSPCSIVAPHYACVLPRRVEKTSARSRLSLTPLSLCARGLAPRRRRRHGRPSKAPHATPSCSTHPPAPSKAERRAAIAHACRRSRCCPCASPSPVELSSAAMCRLPCCGHTWPGRHGPPPASPSAPTSAGGHVGARAAFLHCRSPLAHRHRRRGHH